MEGCVGEESFQMWELNRRLEAYLTRVKTLEEQNQLLSAELGGLRAQSGDTSWRARADDELAALRVLVDQRWREKHEAEVQRDNLAEELESVAGRCQQVRLARERTIEEAACSRRTLEAEKNARGWLSTQAADLERELEALRAAHEEERAHLNAQAACAPRRSPAPPHGSPVRAPEVEELARRLGEVWRGAVRDYQERVAHMESSLGQARERLGQAVRGVRECRLELQQLQADRDSLQEHREALEQRLEGRWQDRLQATEKFQLAVEALEQEKQGLQSQIAQILEGGQQLAHLKMSLSLEVATYRTLLEAENSRLQTPGRSSQASLGFPDPKLKLRFLGIPEDQHLGSVFPVLSPTSFPSLLPNTLETPATTFLKTQEFLQARTPTLASTPIPPMSEAPCPTSAESRAQDVPLSLLQTQGGKQQAPEPLWAEPTVPSSTDSLSELEEPGGKERGQFPENSTSLAPSLNPILEAKGGDSSEPRVSNIFQEDEGQIWEVVEKEAAVEVKVENSLAQETQESVLDMEEIQDSQGLLQKETLEALGVNPLMSLKIQSCETPGKENCNSIEENLGTLKSPEKEVQTPLKSLEEKNVETEKALENGVPGLAKPLGKEDIRMEDRELMSPEGTLETFSFIGKENQEVVRSSEEGNLESLTAFKEESPHPLECLEAEDQTLERLVEKQDQSFPKSSEEEDQEAFRPLQRENQEPLRYEEAEDQMLEKLIEKESQEPLKSPEEEDQSIGYPQERENQEPLRYEEAEDQMLERLIESQEPLKSPEEEDQSIGYPLERENQEPLRYEEAEDQVLERLIEKENQEPLKSPEEEDQSIGYPQERENQEPLRYEEAEDQVLERLIEKESQEPLKSPEEKDQEAFRPLEKENQEPLRYEEAEDQVLEKLIEKENQEPLKSPEEEDQNIGYPLERENQESLMSLEENQETIVPLESRNERSLRSLEVEEEEQTVVKPLEKMSQDSRSLEKENVQPLRYLEEDDCTIKSLLEDKTHEFLGSLEDRNGESIIPPESETQGSLRPPEEEDQGIVNHLEKESQEFLRSPEQVMERSLEQENLSYVEKEDQMIESQLEKESQDSGKSLEDECQENFGPLAKENPESLRSLAGQDQEEQKLEQETQQTLRAVGDEQTAVSPPEELDPELLKPLGNDQEIVRSLEKENQESLVSLKENGMETVKSSETENIEALETAEEDLERRMSIDAQEPSWSTKETIEPLEDEIQESLGTVDENQETLTPLERESQELRSPGKWNLETVESPGGVEDSQQCLEVGEVLEREQHGESLRSLGEVEQELSRSGNQQRWEDVEGSSVGQEAPLGTTGVETEDKTELPLKGQGGKEEAAEEGEPLQDVVGEAWSLGSSEPKEQRVPAEDVSNMEGQPEQMGTLEVPVVQEMPKVTEQDEDRAQAGEQDSVEVTLGIEAARAGLELEQEVVGIEDPRHFAREEAIHPSPGEESVKAKIAQGLEGPGKEPKEAGALDSGVLELPKTSSEALECKGYEESESTEDWREEASLETSDHEGSDAPEPRPPETEEDEGAQAEQTAHGSKLMEPCSPIPIPTDAHELQPQAEGIQEPGWQPEAGSEALGKVEDEPEFGLGDISEGLQDWEEGREESEADELGETLPDSTPLGLYLRSPSSPKWDLSGEQRLSPQGEAKKEGWGPAVLAAQGLSDPPEEEEQGHGSDLSSEEFEDLGTEASLSGVPKEVADHLGHVPPVLQPACWDHGEESDGFADEEESGEEGEEEDADEEGAESEAQWWGSGPSGEGGFKVQDITQRGDLKQESVGVSSLWDDGLRGAAANVPVTALETVSQDSAEPSGSEESESASFEGEEGQVTDRLDAHQEVTSMAPGAGDTLDIHGQGSNLESEQVNGRMENGVEQAGGQVVLDGDEDQELPLQEQEVGALKAPLVGSPLHLGPNQPLKFTLSGVDGDSWSSGED